MIGESIMNGRLAFRWPKRRSKLSMEVCLRVVRTACIMSKILIDKLGGEMGFPQSIDFWRMEMQDLKEREQKAKSF